MYIKNNYGPTIELRGTPALTLVHEEDCPFDRTRCFLFVKKIFKTFSELPDIPFSCNLNIRPWCQALTNAFEMSRKIPLISKPS